MQTPPNIRRRRLWQLVPFLAITAAAFTGSTQAAAPQADQSTANQAEIETGAEAEGLDLLPFVPADFIPAQHGLSDRPLIVPSLGLAMFVPEARITSDRSAGQMVVSVHDAAATPAWSVTIQHLYTAANSTPEDQIKQHTDALTAAGRRFDVLENTAFTAGNANGRLCYIRQSTNDEGDDAIITGWLILPAGPDVMLVFSILSMPEELPWLRTAFDAAFRTINLRPVAEISLQRRSRMEAGRALLESLTPQRLHTMLDTRQWSRVYRTDREGREHEVGYTLLEVYDAKRGALDPSRPESSYSQAEQEEGIMVRLQGRIIGDIERRVFYDSIALYWMAWDQSEEAWNVRGTQRQGNAERGEAETGVRIAPSVGNPVPSITVIRQRSSDYQRDPYEWSVPDVYLSQALASVLGRLLPRDEQRAREYAYYFYNYSHSVPQLTQRTDRWEPADDGTWTLTTQLSADSPPVVSTYSASGEFISTRRVDGTITVPESIERIRQIWLRQGLPMSD